MDAKINELVTAMITLYHDDPKRIHHFTESLQVTVPSHRANRSMLCCKHELKRLHWYMTLVFMLRSGNIVLLQGLIKKKKAHRLPVPC